MRNLEQILESANQKRLKGQLSDALLKGNQALSLALTLDNSIYKIDALLSICATLNKTAMFSNQKAFFDQAFSKLQEVSHHLDQSSSQEAEAKYYLHLGVTHFNSGDSPNAIINYTKSLELCEANQLDVLKHEVYLVLAEYYISIDDFEEGLKYSKASLEFSKLTQDGLLQANSYNKIGHIYLKRNQYKQTVEYFEKVLNWCQHTNDIELELNTLSNLAQVHSRNSNYKIALELLFKVFDKSKSIEHHTNAANALINIGTVYAFLYNHHEALKKYNEVIDQYRDVLNISSQIIVLNNVGSIYIDTKQYELAEKYFFRAMLMTTDSEDDIMIAHVNAQLSRTFNALNKLQDAKIFAWNAEDLLQNIDKLTPAKHINQFNLAKICAADNLYEKAIEHSLKGIAFAKAIKDNDFQAEGHLLLSDLYETIENYKASIVHHKLYNELQNTKVDHLRSRYVMDMEIQSAMKEQELKIQMLTKENDYKSMLLSQSKQIKNQNKQLVEANKELKQFAYVVSHDLREPLRMIDSYARLLTKRYGEQLDEEAKIFFDYMKGGVHNMNNLLEDLLRYSTIGKGSDHIEKVDLNVLMNTVIHNLQYKILENKAEVIVGTLPTIQVQQYLMIQLFQNLIGNAIKFKKPDCTPMILISCEQHDKENYIFCVEDNGIGIAPEKQQRVFEIFQRLHKKEAYEGTGIGLAICQKVVNRWGGRIWMESEEGKGTKFYFTFPHGMPQSN